MERKRKKMKSTICMPSRSQKEIVLVLVSEARRSDSKDQHFKISAINIEEAELLPEETVAFMASAAESGHSFGIVNQFGKLNCICKK